MPIRRLEKTYTGTSGTIGADELTSTALASVEHVKPHIQPGVLYPAVANIMLDGSTALSASTVGPNSSTVTSSKYGTVQSDGRMYYYTDIKGSKPIKDPRIGAYFGSQRHKFKSIQKLEQESATHGKNVFSVDGRNWIRAVGFIGTNNTNDGLYVVLDSAEEYVEITGYFNDANIIIFSGPGQDIFNLHLNGTALTDAGADSTVASPLADRYVDAGSVVNIAFSTTPTLGINTIKITYQEWLGIFGIELIAQDTTSTATKSKIQIPAQNVVSYGKKFALSAAAHHYNPFAQSQTDAAVTIKSSTTNTAKLTGGWSGTGATYYSSELDTATSLGLSAWVSGGEYFRPVNGGRVVWWVNSSGSLKCSVNMMPPAGTAVGGVTSGHNVPTGVHNWATKYQPALYSTTIDNSQAEVAGNFHWREFGNGAANGNQSATFADASMLAGTHDDIAYVMDDGLTSLSADDHYFHSSYGLLRNAAGKDIYMTFIGTGLTVTGSHTGPPITTVVQNLPYGTHIFQHEVDDSSATNGKWSIDGVEVKTDFASGGGNEIYKWGIYSDVTFHQPKMPPIPEDAVVLADYMLMADHVKRTAADYGNLSKGVRLVSCSRDVFYDMPAVGGTNWAAASTNHVPTGMRFYMSATSAAGNIKMKLPAFGTSMEVQSWTHGMNNFYVNGSSVDETDVNSSDNALDFITQDTASTLGMNTFEVRNGATNDGNIQCWFIHTPIHTSSHYQAFETPYTKDLIGGDRNMEQTNLVVTNDGKTWDEVTRDTSYIGNIMCTMNTDSAYAYDSIVIFDEFRGQVSGKWRRWGNKDFAIAYDRLICLKSGQYQLVSSNKSSGDANNYRLWLINGLEATWLYTNEDEMPITLIDVVQLDRGDYVQLKGEFGNDTLDYNGASIIRVG